MASVKQRLPHRCERCLCGQWAKELGRVEELGLLHGVPCLGDFRAFVTDMVMGTLISVSRLLLETETYSRSSSKGHVL